MFCENGMGKSFGKVGQNGNLVLQFPRMNQQFEISIHPEIIFQKDVDVSLISVDGVKLNDDYDEIDFYEIVYIYLKEYDFENDNFTRRMEKFKTHNGYIHLAGKLSFSITDQRVTNITLKRKYIEKFLLFGKEEVIAALGKPDRILLEDNDWSIGTIDTEIFVYANGQLFIFIDTQSKKVNEIRLGIMDESPYRL